MVGLSFANNSVCLSQGGSCEMLSFGIYDQCVAVDPYTVPSTPTAGFLLCLSDDIALCVLRVLLHSFRGGDTLVEHPSGLAAIHTETHLPHHFREIYDLLLEVFWTYKTGCVKTEPYIPIPKP